MKKTSTLLGIFLLGIGVNAHAALPAEAAAAFTTLSGNATDMLASTWPVVVIVTGGFGLMRLFKRSARNAT